MSKIEPEENINNEYEESFCDGCHGRYKTIH